jgi:hypothetical protein
LGSVLTLGSTLMKEAGSGFVGFVGLGGIVDDSGDGSE